MKTTNQNSATSPRANRRSLIRLGLLCFLSAFVAPFQSFAQQVPTVNPPLTGFSEPMELKTASSAIRTSWEKVHAIPTVIKNGDTTKLVGQLRFKRGAVWVPLPNKRVTIQIGGSNGQRFNTTTDRSGIATYVIRYDDPKFGTTPRSPTRTVGFEWNFKGDAAYKSSFSRGNFNVNPTPPSASDIALAQGEKFLAENAKKAGVKVTGSGLQYKVIAEGTGKSPQATDTVKMHYEAKLIDGKVFDSSYNSPGVVLELNNIIAGLAEGLQLMREGSKFHFFIPSSLAYGRSGAGNVIGPNAVLIFDVELLKVQ